VQNLRFVSSAIPEILGGSQNLKSRSRDLGHAPFWPIFHFFGLVSLTVHPSTKFEVCTFSYSRDIRGSQNLKVGHVTLTTLPCDLILYFWISTSWSPVEIQISTWLDLLFWRYCHCKISAFWLENAGPIFSGFWGFWPPEVMITHKGISLQYFQKHAFSDITRQNRSSGLTASCAEEQIKKHRPLTFHPFVGVTPLKRLICH